MKWYGLGAVGFTMLITAVGLQWAVLTEAFFEQCYNQNWEYIDVSIYSLLRALFAISSVLISFGAVIGKITPPQLLTLTFLELIFYSINDKILMFGWMGLVDVGGTYVDHMFGAYFGLTVAYVLGKPASEPLMGHVPDMFSFVGTVFLWIYWPSFVAGDAEANSNQQHRAIVNTIFALSASTIATFCFSGYFTKHNKFRPIDIQNATLAGGVAIGCSANLTLNPINPIIIGLTAGIVSSYGYHYLQVILQNKWRLHDTCGIHNLHGMPSIIGGLASTILAAYKSSNDKAHDSAVYGDNQGSQWYRQLLAIPLCVSFAIITGLVSGFLITFIFPKNAELLLADEEAVESGPLQDPSANINGSYTTNALSRSKGHHHQQNLCEFNDAAYWEIAFEE